MIFLKNKTFIINFEIFNNILLYIYILKKTCISRYNKRNLNNFKKIKIN